MDLDEVPVRIERRPAQGKQRRDGFEATVEHKHKFADGRMETDKINAVLDDDMRTMVRAPDREEVEKLRGMLERWEPIDGLADLGNTFSGEPGACLR
jgi:hypothetical protein